MFPAALLTRLSPNACKVYLALRTKFDPASSTPFQCPIQSLSTLTALAPRTCSRALSELAHAKLLDRLPFHYHHPRSYVLLPIPTTDSPPQADLLNPPPSDPPAQASLLTPAPRKTDTPAQATLLTQKPSKTDHPPQASFLNPKPRQTDSPVQATLLNQISRQTDPPPQADHIEGISLEEARREFAQMPPEQKAAFITMISARFKAMHQPGGILYPGGV